MSTVEATPSDADLKPCDIVLKGGITSGVVYPGALVTLSKRYRFSQIGGTSAGAIGAAAAAAAEYGRYTPGAGFDRLDRIPGEIGSTLAKMFQPTMALKPLFDLFIGLSGAKGWSGPIVVVFSVFWLPALVGVLAGLIITLMLSGGVGAIGVFLALVGAVAAIVGRIAYAILVELKANDYGLCPGLSQPFGEGPAFTEWLHTMIQEAAGKPLDDPLTFGDLTAERDGRPKITLKMMTTSLMESRPYTLPLEAVEGKTKGVFCFRPSEWSKLFPPSVMAALIAKAGAPVEPDLYRLPIEGDMPVVVATRMSLSFPGLIQAVPLWRKDFLYIDDVDRNVPRRCLFSDGGLSSNFPIHLFDKLLPGAPTFAISLVPYSVARHGRQRVNLPTKASGGLLLPVNPVEDLPGFAMRLLDSAKDWQDNLRAILPGYRERIARIALDGDEGGLNLDMPPEVIKTLSGYGAEAGQAFIGNFDFDAHRWRRFLVAMAALEEAVQDIEQAYRQPTSGAEPYASFLDRYPDETGSYRQTAELNDELRQRAAELAELGAKWRTRPQVAKGRIPKPRAVLRITPHY